MWSTHFFSLLFTVPFVSCLVAEKVEIYEVAGTAEGFAAVSSLGVHS